MEDYLIQYSRYIHTYKIQSISHFVPSPEILQKAYIKLSHVFILTKSASITNANTLEQRKMSREIEPLIVGRVIGDVLEMFNPSVTMRVTFNSNTIVSNGHELAPSLLLSKPRVEIGGQDLRSFFTLVRNQLSSKLKIHMLSTLFSSLLQH